MSSAGLRLRLSARPALSRRLGPNSGAELSVDVAFENAHGRAADLRHQASSRRSDLDLNFTRPPHLDALQDRQRLTWLQPFALDKISAERSTGGTGGRIFDEPPRQHSASEGFPSAAEREAVGHHA